MPGATKAPQLALSLLLLLTLVGAPAPTAIGWAELAIVGLAGLIVLVALAGLQGRRLAMSPASPMLLLVLMAYALVLVSGSALGVLHGSEPAAVARAVGPYLIFLPVGAALLLRRQADPGGADWDRAVARAFIVAGVAHAAFLFGLLLFGVGDLASLRAVFLGRTTLLDSRTTLPLFLGAAILPLAWLVEGRGWTRLGAGLLCALGWTAALSTQTRAQLVALVGAAFMFAVLYGRLARLRRAVLVGTAAIIVAGVVLAFVPPWSTLTRALILRVQTASDNSRLDDEWIPAVQTMLDTGPGAAVAGIGAGRTFLTGAGEERTYVHNLGIYVLLYHGFAGVLVTGLLYLLLFACLARRAIAERDARTAAFAALLVGLALYAQFFAVHKLLSYNLMLALLLPVAAGRRGTVAT